MKAFDLEAEFRGDTSNLEQATKDAVKAVEDIERAAGNLGKASDAAASSTDRIEASLKNTSKAARTTAVATRNLSTSMNAAGQQIGAVGSTIGALGSVARSGGTDLGALAGAGGNLASVFSMKKIGPWLAAITLVAGGIQMLVEKHRKAKKAAAELLEQMNKMADATAPTFTVGAQSRLDALKSSNLEKIGLLNNEKTLEIDLQRAAALERIRDIQTEIVSTSSEVERLNRLAAVAVGRRATAFKKAADSAAERLQSLHNEMQLRQIEEGNLQDISREMLGQVALQAKLTAELRRQARIDERRKQRQAERLAALREEKRLADELRKAFTMGMMGPAPQRGVDLLEADMRPDNDDLNPRDPFLEPAEATEATDHTLGSLGLFADAIVQHTQEFEWELRDSAIAAKSFGERLEDVTARGIDSFMAMLTDGSLLSDVAAGRGGESVGAEVGAIAGGVIGSFFGGAAVGEAIGGVLGSIMGESLDELVDALGVLTPLFDAVAVIIRAFTPVLLVVRLLFEGVGFAVESLAPIIQQVAKLFAGSLLPWVRVINILLMLVEVVLTVVSGFSSLLDIPGILLGGIDFLMRWLSNVIVNVVLAFIGLHNGLIDFMRELTGFDTFGTKMDGDAAERRVRDEMALFNGENDNDQTTALDANTEALREFGRSLTNIPSGYRVPLAEYRAETTDGNGGVVINGPVTMVLERVNADAINGELGRQRGYPVPTRRSRSGN